MFIDEPFCHDELCGFKKTEKNGELIYVVCIKYYTLDQMFYWGEGKTKEESLINAIINIKDDMNLKHALDVELGKIKVQEPPKNARKGIKVSATHQ